MLYSNKDHKRNLIVIELVENLRLEIHDKLSPYLFGWENTDAKIKVTKQCKIRFSISVDFIDEVELYVVPLDVCEMVFVRPYMYMWDEIFMHRSNQYHLIKDLKSFIINTQKGKLKLLLVSSN